ncbi:MAG: hypothetical protein WCA07_02375 [Gloeobacterales cyanobacterium]
MSSYRTASLAINSGWLAFTSCPHQTILTNRVAAPFQASRDRPLEDVGVMAAPWPVAH